MKSASNRFDLALSMTAGKDTRLILAASKEINKKLLYYTGMYWDMNEKSWDISIPGRLLSRLGLNHHIIKCPSEMSNEFRELYLRSVQTAREIYGLIAQGLYDEFPSGKVAVKGNAIPITRVLYREKLRKIGKLDTDKISAHDIAFLSKMGNFKMANSKFAINAYERWLSEIDETYNIDILNLLYWEDIEGSWQAMSQLEWDIVHEIFVPYNCRSFLINVLSLDEQDREAPDFKFHRAMIMELWPEAMKEPINPKFNSERTRTVLTFLAIKRFLEKTCIDQLIPKKIRGIGRTLFRL